MGRADTTAAPPTMEVGLSVARQRGIDEWREQVLMQLLRIIFILGTVVALPSMVLLLHQGLWPIAVLDLATLAVLLTLWRRRSLPFAWRAGAFCGLLYLLGMAFLLSMGVESQVYLMAAPVMAGVLLGQRAAFGMLGVATLSLLLGGYFNQVDVRVAGLEAHPFWMWVVIGANFALVAGLLTISLVLLLRGLEQSLERASNSEESYRVAFDTSPDAMIVSRTDDGTIMYVNRSFLRLLGWSHDEVIGRTGVDMHLWADASVRVAVQEKLRTQGLVENMETELVCKDGSPRTGLLSARAMHLSGVPCFLYVARDITDRKEAEEELQRYRQGLEVRVAERTSALEQSNRSLELQHDFIQTVTDAAPVLISYWDASLQCRFANQAFHSLFAASVDQFLGVAASDLLWSDFYKSSAPFLASALRGATQRYPAHVARPPQSTRFLLVQCVPRRVGDSVVGVYMLADDITELKLAERQLRGLNYELAVQVEVAETANRAKSEFLATMSHEIRTPMNGVLGMVELMQQTSLSVPQQRMLDTIYRSSDALLSILNDILDYSKIEAGKLEVERVPTRLRDVIEGMMSLLDPAACSKGVELSAQIAPVLPEWLLSDPTRLQQILINLLGNSVKFTASESGHVGRVVLAVQSGVAADGRAALLLRVSDNGIGIEKEMQQKLFHPFTQANSSIARKFGGTGLGLSITSQLVTLMGGEVTVRSEPGVGSEFVVALPLYACEPGVTELGANRIPVVHRAAIPMQTPASDQRTAVRPLILLAEDNETNRDVIAQQLQLLGYAVDCATDGEMGLAMWRSGRFALLMTDCHRPKMDGFALTQAIRAAEGSRSHLPIIAVTANAMQGEEQRCRAAGMDDYLSKPLRLNELQAMLNRWLPLVDLDSFSATPVWDPQILTRMVGDSLTVRNRVLEKFLLNSRESVAQLTALTQDGNPDAVAEMTEFAHKLKSGARTVGALALGDACQQLEDAGRAGDEPAAVALAPHVVTAYEDASGLIRRDLDQQISDKQGA